MPESTVRGALTEAVYYILLSLHRPMHGYAIMQDVQRRSGGRVALGPGTLYGALNTMVDKGWIMSLGAHSDSRKKEYEITVLGQAVFRQEMLRLCELLAAGAEVWEGGSKDEQDKIQGILEPRE